MFWSVIPDYRPGHPKSQGMSNLNYWMNFGSSTYSLQDRKVILTIGLLYYCCYYYQPHYFGILTIVLMSHMSVRLPILSSQCQIQRGNLRGGLRVLETNYGLTGPAQSVHLGCNANRRTIRVSKERFETGKEWTENFKFPFGNIGQDLKKIKKWSAGNGYTVRLARKLYHVWGGLWECRSGCPMTESFYNIAQLAASWKNGIIAVRSLACGPILPCLSGSAFVPNPMVLNCFINKYFRGKKTKWPTQSLITFLKHPYHDFTTITIF